MANRPRWTWIGPLSNCRGARRDPLRRCCTPRRTAPGASGVDAGQIGDVWTQPFLRTAQFQTNIPGEGHAAAAASLCTLVAAASSCSLRYTIATSAPSLANRIATVRPIPLSPPVIKATWPCSFPLPRYAWSSAWASASWQTQSPAAVLKRWWWWLRWLLLLYMASSLPCCVLTNLCQSDKRANTMPRRDGAPRGALKQGGLPLWVIGRSMCTTAIPHLSKRSSMSHLENAGA